MHDAEHPHPYNPDFVHHQHGFAYLYGREIVFGMQDGMVSSLGALTGIAVGSHDHFTVLLSGFAIIAVGAISMAIGTFNSISMEKKIEERILYEERVEIENDPAEEKKDAEAMFRRDGWPTEIAVRMAEHAAKDNDLMLREMSYRELSIPPTQIFKPVRKAAVMFFAWLVGGSITLVPYFFLSVHNGIAVSISATLIGLFLLGAIMSRFTRRSALLGGVQIMLLAGAAIIAGYTIGVFVDMFIRH